MNSIGRAVRSRDCLPYHAAVSGCSSAGRVGAPIRSADAGNIWSGPIPIDVQLGSDAGQAVIALRSAACGYELLDQQEPDRQAYGQCDRRKHVHGETLVLSIVRPRYETGQQWSGDYPYQH
jgi:hypothetical protein